MHNKANSADAKKPRGCCANHYGAIMLFKRNNEGGHDG